MPTFIDTIVDDKGLHSEKLGPFETLSSFIVKDPGYWRRRTLGLVTETIGLF